jgi:hypothetical protein
MDNMELITVLGNLGEFIGSIAVLVTLVYLARQMKQNNRSQSAESYNTVVQGFNDINQWVATDQTLADIMLKGEEDRTLLTPSEERQFLLLTQSYLNQYSRMFHLYKAGMLEESIWHMHLGDLAGRIDTMQLQLFTLPDELRSTIAEHEKPKHGFLITPSDSQNTKPNAN